MKKILFLAFALSFTATGIFAQSGSGNVSFSTGQQAANPNAYALAKDATDKLNSLVNLSPDQFNQVMQVNQNYYNHPHPSNIGRGNARQQSGREQQLQSILTSDQWQQYQTAKQQGQIE